MSRFTSPAIYLAGAATPSEPGTRERVDGCQNAPERSNGAVSECAGRGFSFVPLPGVTGEGVPTLPRVYVPDIDVWRTVKAAAWIRSGAGIGSP